ncbi:MAG: hypothetical protein KC609_12215 [Myxococcales bacterium]|nr:hypothetical protein [Myxococcales bacterium]
MSRATAKSPWVASPPLDLLLIAFGWLIAYLPLALIDAQFAAERNVRLYNARIQWVILAVLLVNYVHRHYTFLLVYGDRAEFHKHKSAYVIWPLVAVAVTALSVQLSFFTVLAGISVAWTIYHTIAQKFGILRVYGGKAGYGKRWIDLGFVWSGLLLVVLVVFARERTGILAQYAFGRRAIQLLEPLLPILPWLRDLAAALFAAFVGLFAVEEIRNRQRLSLGRVAFAISILALYALFLRSLITAYIVFGFSHALEYVVFVNAFVRSKYRRLPENHSPVARAVRRYWVVVPTVTLLLALFSYGGLRWDAKWFGVYIVGSSFLHFIYDGLIWKVRKPDVARPLEVALAPTGDRSPLA